MEVGGRNNSYPGGKLSNFTGFKFVFEDVECNSMEGLLQAFKFENIDSQIATCQLVGFAAKKKGFGRNTYWQQKQTLWWKNKAYPRKSKDYQILLNKVYNALYSQNKTFRKIFINFGFKSVFTGSNNNYRIFDINLF